MIRVVQERWNLINIFMENYFKPYTVSMVNFLEWLAEDVEENFGTITESLKNSDGAGFFWIYWGWFEQKVTSYFVCSNIGTEESLAGLYYYLLSVVGYFEPSFKLFGPDSLCKLFDFCEEEGENYAKLREMLESSKVREVMLEIYTHVLQIKQATICNNNHVLNTYWAYVLF